MADFLNINEVLINLDLKEDMIAAEFGCGSAIIAIALSKKFKKGRVYAIDIQQEKLSALKERAHKEGINNIFPILCDLEAPNGSTLQADSLDLILIPNVLFQSENKHAIIKEAARVLKQAGQLLIIDWIKKVAHGHMDSVVSPEEVKKISEGLGLRLKKEFAFGDYHYGLLFAK